MKVCSKCGDEKSAVHFNKHSQGRDGLRPDCKECVKEYKKKYAIINAKKLSEKSREYRENNVEKLKAVSKKYYRENIVDIKIKAKKYREDNKDRMKEYGRKYREFNKKEASRYRESYKLTRNKNRRDKYSTNIVYNLECRIRSRINDVFGGSMCLKDIRTYDIIGCTWEELKIHLESQFADGMSWDNRDKWHIDHIVPLSIAEKESDFEYLAHYSNLQPLWAEDNLKKSNNIL